MKRIIVALALAALLPWGVAAAEMETGTSLQRQRTVDESNSAPHSVARKWNEVLLDAIRADIPKPTVHARNLFHVSVAMWDAWAIYDPTAKGYLYEIGEHLLVDDVKAAREEAISHAAYRVLKHRYRYGPGEVASQQAFDDLMDELGYDRDFTSTAGKSPAAIGNYIGQLVIDYGLSDGANEGVDLDYADDTGYAPVNPPMILALPGTTMSNPNRWQPLAFEFLILQNGIVIGNAIQEFVGPNWGKVAPFALEPSDMSAPWLYFDPGRPPRLGVPSEQGEFRDNAIQLIRLSSYVDPNDGVMMDISPGAIHNNPLGTHDGTGRPENPYTGMPYEPNVVKRADYGRVIAEFWADGPESETPPGHWNTLANYVTDHPLFKRRLAGNGPELKPLEWDVKLYLALNGAVHDAAIGAWGCKGYYDYSRPISHIRHMSGLGQSTSPSAGSYNYFGIPLEDGLIEVITPATTAPGERHAHLAGFEGEIALYAWRGIPNDPETEIGGVGWIRAIQWWPYQRQTFVTPPFAGYVSGHSTFSRAAAEVLAAITGDEFFPGGMGTFDAAAGEYLAFEVGPTEDVQLQWATYFDAADEAGISRLWGGIHPSVDDLPGRIMGSEIGKRAWAKAQQYYGNGPEISCPTAGQVIEIPDHVLQALLENGGSVDGCELVIGRSEAESQDVSGSASESPRRKDHGRVREARPGKRER